MIIQNSATFVPYSAGDIPTPTNGDIWYNGSTNKFRGYQNGAATDLIGAGGGSSALSSITAATTTNTINNVSYLQEWQWNSLAGTDAFKLSSTSTAAASNAQTLFNIALSGANATTTQTTYGAQISNVHTGTLSTNIGLYSTASGATYNCAIAAGSLPSAGVPLGTGVTAPGVITITTNSIATTLLDTYGLLLSNTTVASTGAQQMSPGVVWQGNGYRDTTSVGSQDTRFRAAVLPVQGSSQNPSATWQLASSINGASYNNAFTVTSAGVGTFTNSLSCNGGFSTSTTSTNSNLYVASASSASATNVAGLLFATGGGNVSLRVGFNGTTNSTMGAGNPYGNVIVGSMPATEGATGTHSVVANLVVKGIPITNGAGSTTDAAALYVDGPATHTGSVSGGLYSILVGSGNTKLNGDLYCNGYLSNNNNVPTTSYAELKAGTTSLAPLVINSGTLKITVQPGAIEYNNSFYITPSSRVRLGVGGVGVSDPASATSPASNTLTVLKTYTTIANTFNLDGDSIDFYYGGNIRGNSSATQELKVFFAGKVLIGSGTISAPTGNDYGFQFNCKIMRGGNSRLRYSCTFILDGSSPKCTSGELSGLAYNVTNDIELKSQASGSPSAGDVEVFINKFTLFPVAAP